MMLTHNGERREETEQQNLRQTRSQRTIGVCVVSVGGCCVGCPTVHMSTGTLLMLVKYITLSADDTTAVAVYDRIVRHACKNIE